MHLKSSSSQLKHTLTSFSLAKILSPTVSLFASPQFNRLRQNTAASAPSPVPKHAAAPSTDISPSPSTAIGQLHSLHLCFSFSLSASHLSLLNFFPIENFQFHRRNLYLSLSRLPIRYAIAGVSHRCLSTFSSIAHWRARHCRHRCDAADAAPLPPRSFVSALLLFVGCEAADRCRSRRRPVLRRRLCLPFTRLRHGCPRFAVSVVSPCSRLL